MSRGGQQVPTPSSPSQSPVLPFTVSQGKTTTERLLRMSGLYRMSGIFRFTAPVAEIRRLGFRRRPGLRWRLSLFLIVATLVPVIAVSAVSIALVFSSVEQGIEFEGRRGLQLARAHFLREVRSRAAAAYALGGDPGLLEAVAHEGAPAGKEVWARLRELSAQQPDLLLEVTDAKGQVLARCAAGACGDEGGGGRFAAFEPPDHSPVLHRALEFERSVSIEPAGGQLAIRASLPLVDPALRLLGAVVISARVDGPMADEIKTELGAGREVIFYRGSTASASTFSAPTGERLNGPGVPAEAIEALQAGLSPLSVVTMGAGSYSVAFGPIRDVAGRRVGLLGIALDREALAAARRRVMLTLLLGVMSVLLIALGLADLLARRLTRPLADLHAAALSIATGNLQTRLNVDSPDELGDVAEAFRVMIQSLRENREGLAARVRELVTVHQVGRAVSSVVDLNQVLRSVASEAMAVLGARTAAIALVAPAPAPAEPGGQRTFFIRAVAGEPVGNRLAELARLVAAKGGPRRAIAVEWDPELADAAAAAELTGPLLAAPLSLKDRIVGVILVGRLGDAPFSEADLRLLITLADQTATAIENARLYSEVRAFSENLELKVRERTAELERAKAETEDALRELRTAQSQLIHSERMAGLGLLVAGIAHEVNSPAAAVQGSADVLELTVQRLEQQGRALRKLELSDAAMARFFAVVERAMEVQRSVSLSSAVETRHLNRRLRTTLAGGIGVERAAFALGDLGPVAEEIAGELKQIAAGKDLVPLAGYLRELAFLVRASNTIRTAIQSIRRIVGALKRYSRLDEAPVEDVDVHAGIEDTLVILAHQLKSSEKGINLKRSYGSIPRIAAYAGELNQVWTNLIFNAVQAVEGSGEILIETSVEGGHVRVAIQDDGPGVQPEVMSKIFEPFFTTKGKGEGTGLGLSIAHRIVEKHGGTIRVESIPGRTRFEVRLPIKGPLAPRLGVPNRDGDEEVASALPAGGQDGRSPASPPPLASAGRVKPSVPSPPPRGQGRG